MMNTAPRPVPLSPAVFAVLLALADGDKHGYAIMKQARTPQGGSVPMGPGTLYGTLDRLIRDGMVEETGMTDDERRRYYRIRDKGCTALAAELDRLNSAIVSARKAGLLAHGGRS
ncbi:MAG: PadR family transcriptional regulator [Terracidiphilus sp.]